MCELKKELTSLLENLNRDKRCGQEVDNIFEIATIFFSFHNCKLLTMLESRGENIRKGCPKLIHEKNQEIQEYIRANFNQIRRPASAYVTFKKIQGSVIAKHLLHKPD